MLTKQNAGLSVIFAVIILGGCGGDTVDGTGTLPITVAPTPPPASPPPPPPPPPPPTSPYSTIPSLVGTQTLQTTGGGVRLRNASQAPIVPTAIALSPFGSAVTFGLTGGGAPFALSSSSVTESFAAANLDASGTSAKVVSYSKRDAANAVTSRLILETPVTNNADLGYLRMFEWVNSLDPAGSRTYFGLAAVPTIATDMPQTGIAQFGVTQTRGVAYTGTSLGGSSNGTFNLRATIANCTVNFTTRQVLVQMVLVGTNSVTGAETHFGNFTGGGTLGVGARTFSGTYTPLGNNLTGTVSGVFAGPQAAECGLSFIISGTHNGAPLIASGVQAGGRALKEEILP